MRHRKFYRVAKSIFFGIGGAMCAWFTHVFWVADPYFAFWCYVMTAGCLVGFLANFGNGKEG